jgi:Hemerythrin HHE cation binding domain
MVKSQRHRSQGDTTVTIIIPETNRAAFELVAVDIYRDIHKGIRSELFAVTEQAGRLDSSDGDDRVALACHVRSVIDLLVGHAEHEDRVVHPVLATHLPAFAEKIAADHTGLDARLQFLGAAVDGLVESASRGDGHRLYMELASFTSEYLEHQDLEERAVMPALDGAVGTEAVIALQDAIIASIPPDEMGRSLAIMLPAMNVDDRAELLTGMRAGAPAPVFQGVWSLARSVLSAYDHAALAARLGLG